MRAIPVIETGTKKLLYTSTFSFWIWISKNGAVSAKDKKHEEYMLPGIQNLTCGNIMVQKHYVWPVREVKHQLQYKISRESGTTTRAERLRQQSDYDSRATTTAERLRESTDYESRPTTRVDRLRESTDYES